MKVYGDIGAALDDGLLVRDTGRWAPEAAARRKAGEITAGELIEAEMWEREPWWVGDLARIEGMSGYAVGRRLAVPRHEWRGNPAGTVHAYAYITPARRGDRPWRQFGGPTIIAVTRQLEDDGSWRGLWRADWLGANVLEDSIHHAAGAVAAMAGAMARMGFPFSAEREASRLPPAAKPRGASIGP